MQQQSPFKTLKILHTALLGGLGMFIVIGFIMVRMGLMGDDYRDSDMIFQVIAALLSITMLLAGYTILKKRLVEVRNSQVPAQTKMDMYRSVCIMWWAMLEGPGLFAIVAYMLVGNYAFLALSLFHFVLLFVFMPRKENIIMLLNLTSDDVYKLENPAKAR